LLVRHLSHADLDSGFGDLQQEGFRSDVLEGKYEIVSSLCVEILLLNDNDWVRNNRVNRLVETSKTSSLKP
jgi:hypothetical protein